MSNIAEVKPFDIANGRGIGVSVFFSGCEFHCHGCFNEVAWDFNYGVSFDREFYETKIKPYVNKHISHLSILGGEPMHPRNVLATLELVKWFKQDFPDKTIWLWSGYTFDELLSVKDNVILEINKEVLNTIDILVDGRFVEEKKDLTLKWKGSSNQRVIDIKKTLKEEKVVLYE